MFIRPEPANFCGRSKYHIRSIFPFARKAERYLPLLYLSVKLWVMKDFAKVLIMLVLVFASMALVVYLTTR